VVGGWRASLKTVP